MIDNPQNIIVMEENKIDPRIKWIKESLYSLDSNFSVEIDNNDKVVIHGNILIPSMYTNLPYKIDEIFGNVIIDNIQEPIKYGNLSSLQNFPTIIHGDFICKLNPKLKSLKGGPEKVEGNFICAECGLTSIDHLPKYIGGNLDLYNNEIRNLSPINESKVIGLVDVQFNPCENDKTYNALLKENKISYV